MTTEKNVETTELARALPLLVKVEELAALIRTSKKAVYGLIERDEVPGVVRIGRRVLFRREALVRWLTENGGAPSPRGTRR